jgi:hypothetical protein
LAVTTWLKEAKNDDRRENGLQARWKDRTCHWWTSGIGLATAKRFVAEGAYVWTFLSPSYFFAPGERTGKFRLGKDELLVAADGQSRISTEDFAIALVDELEQPKHSRQRFTVGY